MRERFKNQQERQAVEQLKREQLELYVEDLQQQISMEQLKRQQLETYIEELLSRPSKLPFVKAIPSSINSIGCDDASVRASKSIWDLAPAITGTIVFFRVSKQRI